MNLIYALTAIHNFICIYAGEEALERGINEEELDELLDVSVLVHNGSTNIIDFQRERITKAIWKDYV